MKIGSLFAGYGGLDLAVEAVTGATPAWFSEVDAAPSRILAHHWPDVPNHGDITAIDFRDVEPVDILTGGFPCQDVSHAGRRKGLGPGTRSGLWSHMARAIDELRPRLVVAENVRGLLSASADSDLEPCPWCVGDGGAGRPLRALGAVLGDLADIGYDAAWAGVRAADVGAPHGRFRVFIAAWPSGDTDGAGLEGWRAEQRAGERLAGPSDLGAVADANRLGHERPWSAWGRRPRLEDGNLLPTPRATDGTKGGPNQRGSSGDLMLPSAVTLLPTPAVNDMGKAYTPDQWDDWTARMQAAHGNGNGHGKSLEIEAQRLTMGAGNAGAAEARSGEGVRGLRGTNNQEALREPARGQDAIPRPEDLLAGLREHARGSDEGRSPLASSPAQGGLLPGVRDQDGPARSPQGQEPREQRPVEPSDAVRVMSSAVALAGGPRGAACGCAAWGQYAPAIHGWEAVLRRPAPAPTEPTGKDGAHRLSPLAVEFMMGLPAGWVTGVPGISRNHQLKALGNGVVPQQAAAALAHLLGFAPSKEAAA